MMKNKNTWYKLFIVFTLTFVYAYIRYILFGQVDKINIPTVIVNKAFAFSIVIWLFFLIKGGFKTTEELKLKLNILQSLIFIHVFLSLVLLADQQLPKFFSNAKLTLCGNLTVLSGTVTLSVFFWLSRMSKKITFLIFSVLLEMHLFFMGFKGWFEFEKWNGGLPPITLICFLLLLLINIKVLLRT